MQGCNCVSFQGSRGRTTRRDEGTEGVFIALLFGLRP